MNHFIPLAKPDIQDQDIQLVTDVLKSGMLVQGKYVSNLETKFLDFTGASHASAVSNGTATLHLALMVLNIGIGDEVIVPAFSYIATANVVELVGAKPIFVDIDLATFNIDVTQIEAAITPKTKAIIPVHEFGLACNISSVMEIATKHGLFVIEDAACALGAQYNGKHVGSFGDFGSFSLHPRKAISSGEGGVLITNSEEHDKQVKILRNHGVDIIDGEMVFAAFGYNYRLTDFQAALVYSQMQRLQASIEHKRRLAEIYDASLNQKNFTIPFIPNYTNHTWQTYHIIVHESINRNDLIQKMKVANIGVNYGAQCIPHMKVYADKYHLDCESLFPNALKAYKQGLALPIYDLINKEQIHYISETINQLTA
jgi:perosamine synthetase